MPKHGSNIRRRKDGRWEGRYKDVQGDNPCKYKSVYGKTCREVTEKLEMITVRRNQLIEQNKAAESRGKVLVTFGEASEKWLENIREIKRLMVFIEFLF